MSDQTKMNFGGRAPMVVSYGMGVDSTAMLVGLAERGERPDAILFADVGAEKPETYAYLPIINAYLESVGFPQVTVVRYEPKNFKNWPPYRTLEDNCLTNGTLPSLAFGFKSCSLKWKVAPQDKWMNRWQLAQEAWAAGLKVSKLIGYDCSPADTKRYGQVENQDDPKYVFRYPLREWGWNRGMCMEAIAKAGLPVPPKSSCFFCPAMKPAEVEDLSPDLLRRIVRIEARAKPRLTTTQGLWRKATKARPGSMTEFIRSRGLLPAEEVDLIIANTATEIVAFQKGYAEAKGNGQGDDFLAENEASDYRSLRGNCQMAVSVE